MLAKELDMFEAVYDFTDFDWSIQAVLEALREWRNSYAWRSLFDGRAT
jgi:hypothetical protein